MNMKKIYLCLAVAACAFACASAITYEEEGPWRPEPIDNLGKQKDETYGEWIKRVVNTMAEVANGIFKTATNPQFVLGWANMDLIDAIRHIFDSSSQVRGKDSEEYFFKFVPDYVETLTPGKQFSWQSPCFSKNTASVELTDTEATIKISASHGSTWTCSDNYIITTREGLYLKTVYFRGDHVIHWKLPSTLTDAEMDDVKSHGFRVFRFLGSPEDVVKGVVSTLEMFVPALTHAQVPAKTADANIKFMEDYVKWPMHKRGNTIVDLDESEIHSGDFFGILRLDGLDPMLAWAMGAGTGHTTIALWIDGELYICESTTSSAYWPTDGIQKTPYKKWVEQAKAASYNVVHLPLSPEARENFDEKAAYDWFQTVEGLNYGFHNMLLAWIDTATQNYPCLPDNNFSTCLSSQLVETLLPLADKLVPAVGDLMWNQALQFRSESTSSRTTDILYDAKKKGMEFNDVVVLPEQDVWEYNDGYSMVCDVLVCRMWKAAGVFGDLADDINCTEMTNWDTYTLKIFDTEYKRPQKCVDADPDSQFCQMMGLVRVDLPGYNTKAPYAHMAEKCPGVPPLYERPSDC